MKALILNGDLISLKDLARFEDESNFQQAYERIRKRVKRGKYLSYQKIKGEGFISINDSAIQDTLRNSIINASQSLVKHSNIIDEQSNVINNIELSPEETEYCLAFASVINLYVEYLSKYGKDESTRNKFVTLYNHNAFPNYHKHTGNLGSWKTIERWKKEYISSGNDFRIFAKSKQKRGSSVPPQQMEILVKFALNPNQPLISEVVRMSMDVFYMKNILPVLSEHTYRRRLEEWKKEHYADWVFFREGESALDEKILPYLERDYDKIEVGDILVMDGHVDNFETINPFTGKPKRMMTVGAFEMKSSYLAGYEKSPTENTFAIAVALRRAILNLGKIPKVLYIDNGRAFGAKYFHGDEMDNIAALLARLGIKVIFAQAYHAQGKTIENFWGILGELERMVPTYVGTSIEMQPPRLNRGEKLHVKLYEKMMTGSTIDIFTAHKAMAWWLDKYHTRPQQNGHLKGKTPAEIFNAGRGPGIDKRELTFLMMAHKITTIYRNGIRMFNTHFWNESLFGKQWDEVLVRYDILEQDSVFVYDKNGEFICEAKSIEKVHPAAGILGTEEDVNKLHQQLSRKQSLKKMIVGEAKQFLQNEIYPAVKKQFNEINVLPLNSPQEEFNIPEELPQKKKRKSLIDRWTEADIEPKTKRIKEAQNG